MNGDNQTHLLMLKLPRCGKLRAFARYRGGTAYKLEQQYWPKQPYAQRALRWELIQATKELLDQFPSKQHIVILTDKYDRKKIKRV